MIFFLQKKNIEIYFYFYTLLEKNLDKINWSELSLNSNPNAIDLLEKNLDKIN
jgi:hypothetical protein